MTSNLGQAEEHLRAAELALQARIPIFPSAPPRSDRRLAAALRLLRSAAALAGGCPGRPPEI